MQELADEVEDRVDEVFVHGLVAVSQQLQQDPMDTQFLQYHLTLHKQVPILTPIILHFPQYLDHNIIELQYFLSLYALLQLIIVVVSLYLCNFVDYLLDLEPV